MTSEYTYAKPVKAAGVLYRSYTEALWAQLFTELHVGFEYEPLTFSFPDDSLYTPDFYLHSVKRYLEIKNGNVDELACQKANSLAYHLGSHVLLIDGSPKKSIAYVFDGRPPLQDKSNSNEAVDNYAYDEVYGHNPAAIVNKILQPSPYESTEIKGLRAARVNQVVKNLFIGLNYDVTPVEMNALNDKLLNQRQQPVVLESPTAEMLLRYEIHPERPINIPML